MSDLSGDDPEPDNPLRKLIREIHRRSLWQVAACIVLCGCARVPRREAWISKSEHVLTHAGF